jgi:hypothetical protein
MLCIVSFNYFFGDSTPWKLLRGFISLEPTVHMALWMLRDLVLFLVTVLSI